MRAVLVITTLLTACSTSGGLAAWAVDPIWVEPVADGGVLGFQTWQLYGAGWDNGYNDRHYVCAVVVRIDGTPTDCDGPSDDRYLGLEAIQLTLPSPTANEEAPYPGQSSLVAADYGADWEPYGWGWPAALDQGRTSTSDGTFAGDEPFQLRPTVLWDLTL
jgi:hypothetical protein